MISSTSGLTLDLEALRNNLSFLRKHIGPHPKISSVVKSNAYGHGIEQFVPMAEQVGIDHFSVFSSAEALRVFQIKSPDTHLMIMGWISQDEIEWAIQHDVEFYVFDLHRLGKAIQFSKMLNKPARIHLEVETGMNRTGLTNRELAQALALIAGNRDQVSLTGICTHLAGAESIANYYRIQRQLRIFRRTLTRLEGQGFHPEFRHMASSAATLSYPATRMDLVRVGIAQYGFWPSQEVFIDYVHSRKNKSDPLRRVLSWKSRIMSVKEVQMGEFINYGTTFLSTSDRRIAVIPVGYANGFSRSLSNQGRVLIGGERVGVIGLVNMNMMIADITNVPDVKPGDEVVIIGKQGDLEITVASFSEISDQLNYELLARLPADIERTTSK
ncbi:MAG: alanine racemase [Bacteroidetes bacterium]|nr:MAG: alanine racemase [Bacteroidota bacterium]